MDTKRGTGTMKKEIKVKKSLLTLMLLSVGSSLLTLFLIQHLGKIRGGDLFAYPKSYIFENPINSSKYVCYWFDGYPPSNLRESLSIIPDNDTPTSETKVSRKPTAEFWEKLKNARAKRKRIPALAKGSLTGITSANSPTSRDRSDHMPYLMKLTEFYFLTIRKYYPYNYWNYFICWNFSVFS